jgi:hypothetical protein
MRFYTGEECEEWLKGCGLVKPGCGDKSAAIRLNFPKDIAGAYRWANWISAHLTFAMPSLLWITEWRIFPSTENLHLYYTVRRAAHDYRLLGEAPGHLFLNFETNLITSFLQIAMLNGWGGYFFDQSGYAASSFSHDEYFDFYANDPALVKRIRDELSAK